MRAGDSIDAVIELASEVVEPGDPGDRGDVGPWPPNPVNPEETGIVNPWVS